MLKKKNLLKIVSVFATLVFALFLYAPKVEAYGYKDELNVMLTGEGDFIIDPRAEQSLVIKIQYQYQVKDVQVYICKSTASSASCSGADNISTFKDLDNPEDPGGPMKVSPINGGNQGTKIYIYAPSAPYKGMPIRDYVDGDYKVVVKASFCNLRTNGNTECASNEHWTNTAGNYDILTEQVITLKGSFTGNAELNSAIYKALEIVNDYVIPVLWILLGVLLVTRGVILAIGIVKASDEADVRSNKIKGLVWLIIGVFAGYAITISASAVMSIFGYGGVFS